MDRRGCNDEDARIYLGCSENIWADLKKMRVVVALRRGWFSYRMLDAAMDYLEGIALQTSAVHKIPEVMRPSKRKSNTEMVPTSELLARMQSDARRKSA